MAKVSKAAVGSYVLSNTFVKMKERTVKRHMY